MARERLYRMTEIQRNMLVVALMDEYRKQKARGVPYRPSAGSPSGRKMRRGTKTVCRGTRKDCMTFISTMRNGAWRGMRSTPCAAGGVPFPVSWTVKMKKKQKETQDILSYHSQAAGCSDKARAKASGGRQPIEECGRTGL